MDAEQPLQGTTLQILIGWRGGIALTLLCSMWECWHLSRAVYGV